VIPANRRTPIAADDTPIAVDECVVIQKRAIRAYLAGNRAAIRFLTCPIGGNRRGIGGNRRSSN